MFRTTSIQAIISPSAFSRMKTTSAQHVAARHRDPTFEKLMDGYKHLISVMIVHDLIISSPDLYVPLPFISTPAASRILRLRSTTVHFLRSFPAVFSIRPHPTSSLPALVHLTPAASLLAGSISSCAPFDAVNRITRLLSLSPSRSLPLRSLFRIRHELALPRDFDQSIIATNPSIFTLSKNPAEPNTHLISLSNPPPPFVPAIDAWRLRCISDRDRTSSKSAGEEADDQFGFKLSFPPGMKLTKGFRTHVKEWQRLPYSGPYDWPPGTVGRTKTLEKRAVAIAHEFLSLMVEKMVEVEKISHFRKIFGIKFNIRDLFLNHPGIFYLSVKGKRHTVFLREAYDRGCLVEANSVYDARRKLLHLVLMRKRGAAFAGNGKE